ncbi:MAG: hypothetical protein JST04_08675 [Bdellovibrionales bacterium]|nr:hypothetical protein [Bdellovibrionales bacterium]
MKTSMKILAASLVSIALAGAAYAYIPPSNFQIAMLAKKHKGLKSLRVKTRITGPSGQVREIGYYDAATRTWKARFVDQNDREIYAFERKLGVTDSLASLLLFETNPGNIMTALKNAGIPVVLETDLAAAPDEPAKRALEKTSIGRLDHKVGWIIGEGNPSLWILKDDFVPLKLIAGGAEIRFEETKFSRDFPYARSISIYRGNDFVLKGEAMEVMTNPDLADMRAIQVSGIPAIPSSLPSDERGLIEQWVQWIR